MIWEEYDYGRITWGSIEMLKYPVCRILTMLKDSLWKYQLTLFDKSNVEALKTIKRLKFDDLEDAKKYAESFYERCN